MGFRDGVGFSEVNSIGLIKGIYDIVPFKAKTTRRLITPKRKYFSIEELLKSGDYEELITRSDNTLTQLGDALIADALSDRGVDLISHMAVGTGVLGKTTASTTLTTELARVALDSTAQGSGGNDNDVTWIATFPAGTGTGALVEAALFNAAVAGVMFSYTDFDVVNKAAADILIYSWTLTCGLS